MCKETANSSKELLRKAKKDKNVQIVIDGLDGDGFSFILMGKNFGYEIGCKVEIYEIQDALKSLIEYLKENNVRIRQIDVVVDFVSIFANSRRCVACEQIVAQWSNKERKDAQKELNERRLERLGGQIMK